MTLVRSEQREPRVYSVQGSDVLMTVFARPGVVRYVFRFPFDRYVEDVLFLLLFLASTSYVYVCSVLFARGPSPDHEENLSAGATEISSRLCLARRRNEDRARARDRRSASSSPDARRDAGTVRDTDFREQDTPDVRSEVDARRSIVPTHTRARVEYPGC